VVEPVLGGLTAEPPGVAPCFDCTPHSPQRNGTTQTSSEEHSSPTAGRSIDEIVPGVRRPHALIELP
jgi:hypothetical protein